MADRQECSKTILVVDDEEPIRKLVTQVLRAEGYSVFEAADPEQAWKIWSRYRSSIDVLFTDVILPMMNGPELARELSAMRPDLKVVFTTGSSQIAVRETMDLVGHKRFLEKPYSSKE